MIWFSFLKSSPQRSTYRKTWRKMEMTMKRNPRLNLQVQGILQWDSDTIENDVFEKFNIGSPFVHNSSDLVTELLNDQFSHIHQHDKTELSYIFCRRLVDGYRFGKVFSGSSFNSKYCDTTAATAADSDTTSATTTHTVNKLGLIQEK